MRIILPALVMIASMISPALAAPLPWVSTNVRGLVIGLVAGHWEEVEPGADLSGLTLRTLRSGHLAVDSGQVSVEISPNTTLELGSRPASGSPLVKQYLGTLTVTSRSGAQKIALEAGTISVTSVIGQVQISVTETGTAVTVKSGKVSAQSSDGAVFVVTAGVYATNENGALVASASTTESSAHVNGRAPGNGPDNGNSPNGGNGASGVNGNGGGAGNGNGGNSGNGNSGNNGNGNSGQGNGGNNATGGSNGNGGNSGKK